jgi:hypothetical protein
VLPVITLILGIFVGGFVNWLKELAPRIFFPTRVVFEKRLHLAYFKPGMEVEQRRQLLEQIGDEISEAYGKRQLKPEHADALDKMRRDYQRRLRRGWDHTRKAG